MGGLVEAVSRKWQAIYFTIFNIIVIITVGVGLTVVGCVECGSALSDWLKPLREATADGALYGTFVVSAMEVTRMVLLPADFLRQIFIEPLKEKQREEGRAKGIAEGRAEGRSEGIAQGRAQGRAELRTEMLNWMMRRDYAQRVGIEFNEPMQGEDIGSNGSGKSQAS